MWGLDRTGASRPARMEPLPNWLKRLRDVRCQLVHATPTWARKRRDEAGLEDCRAHGLRKAATARLAEIDCPDADIMSIAGRTTYKEIDRYTKGVRQRRLAENAVVGMNKTSE
ncbi:MAG: hypothetical protein J0H20_12730 [Rhizobiales bacterium]|nr:hypothetical protein [Hyphomicrobiales bacterium]